MGKLSDLTDDNKITHLVLTDSSKMEMYVYDVLKGVCGATLESVYTINSQKSFSEMLDLVMMQPFLANKWLFVIEYGRVKSQIKKYPSLFEQGSSKFLVKVANYKEFKEFKELVANCNDLYLSFIHYHDVMFLLKGYELSQKLKDFVAKSYARTPEKIFDLTEALSNGIEITDRKSIVSVCGMSSGSINSFALSLLKEMPKTEKGVQMVQKNRVKSAIELIEAYGSSTFRNFLFSAIKDIVAIKQMYMQGDIYNNIRDIPECFDEKKLSRYNYCLNTIIDIPLGRVMRLYKMLKDEGSWHKSIDAVSFLYKYYKIG